MPSINLRYAQVQALLAFVHKSATSKSPLRSVLRGVLIERRQGGRPVVVASSDGEMLIGRLDEACLSADFPQDMHAVIPQEVLEIPARKTTLHGSVLIEMTQDPEKEGRRVRVSHAGTTKEGELLAKSYPDWRHPFPKVTNGEAAAFLPGTLKKVEKASRLVGSGDYRVALNGTNAAVFSMKGVRAPEEWLAMAMPHRDCIGDSFSRPAWV